jgi:hypothetical protein
MTENWKKFTAAKSFFYIFLIKNCNLLLPRPPYRTSKLQEKPSPLKKEHPALKNMKFLNFFTVLWVPETFKVYIVFFEVNFICTYLIVDLSPISRVNADFC